MLIISFAIYLLQTRIAVKQILIIYYTFLLLTRYTIDLNISKTVACFTLF